MLAARSVLCTCAILLLAAAPSAAESAPVRVQGTRFVAGVPQRVSCAAQPPSGSNLWQRDGDGERRFALAASCPLADDLSGIAFAGREDQQVWSGVPIMRWIVVGAATGATSGALGGELRRHGDGTLHEERGTLIYQVGEVVFVGEYKARCNPLANDCGP